MGEKNNCLLRKQTFLLVTKTNLIQATLFGHLEWINTYSECCPARKNVGYDEFDFGSYN